MPESTVPPKIQPAYAVIRNHIVEDIISGRLPGGQRVTITALQKRYGVSLMPIREALQQLQGEGVLEVQEHKGVWIPEMDVAYVRDQYDIRAAFQSLLTRRCAENPPEQAIDEMRRINTNMRRLDPSIPTDLDGIIEGNWAFHHQIASGAGCRHIVRVYQCGTGAHTALLERWRKRFGLERSLHETFCDQHDEIIDAITHRDSNLAAAVAWQHCTTGRDNMLKLVSQLAPEKS